MQKNFGDVLVRETVFRNELSFYIKPESLMQVCEALMEDAELKVNFLADVTCVDWFEHAEAAMGRYEVVYNLYSISNKYRFFIKVRLPESKPEIASLTPLWQGANWIERETFDLFGIIFVGHSDLSKILTPDELEGHPLRKDFPLTYEVPQFTWNKDLPIEVIK